MAIVRWFRDPKVNVDYASGPLVQMSLDQFRSTGFDWLQLHFREYLQHRLPEHKVVKVFQPGEAKKVMKDRVVVDISRDPDGNLIFAPKELRRYALSTLTGMGAQTQRIIPEVSPPDVFWKTFDEVLTMASGGQT